MIKDPGPALRYRTPARRWTDALPIGNGRLGAMIFGEPGRDRWQLNDDTCWSGWPGTTLATRRAVNRRPRWSSGPARVVGR